MVENHLKYLRKVPVDYHLESFSPQKSFNGCDLYEQFCFSWLIFTLKRFCVLIYIYIQTSCSYSYIIFFFFVSYEFHSIMTVCFSHSILFLSINNNIVLVKLWTNCGIPEIALIPFSLLLTQVAQKSLCLVIPIEVFPDQCDGYPFELPESGC